VTDLSFITNVITSLFCAAVLVQTVRLSRAVHKLRHAGLIEVVASLEAATDTSQQALGALTKVLSAEGPPLEAAVRGARDLRAQLTALRDELSLMIDIGNGVAERILAAANGARGAPREAGEADASAADVAVVGASSSPTQEASEARNDAASTPAQSSPTPITSARRVEKSGRNGRGRALAVVPSTETPSSTDERDQLPDGEVDRTDRSPSAAAEEFRP
jgi:hypothetical protein